MACIPHFHVCSGFYLNSRQYNFRPNVILGFFDYQHRMEFRWSRVELSASCYRVCENAGTLAVQVVRSGNSKDPAYIGIQVRLTISANLSILHRWRFRGLNHFILQVEEGTAKVWKDFTLSSASLIQFDPGAYHFKPQLFHSLFDSLSWEYAPSVVCLCF